MSNVAGTGLALYVLAVADRGARQKPAHDSRVWHGFSIVGETMSDGIFPAFQADWQVRTGEKVEFISSFAGSGTVTNPILLDVPAEVATLALELDAFTLAGFVVLKFYESRRFLSGLNYPWCSPAQPEDSEILPV